MTVRILVVAALIMGTLLGCENRIDRVEIEREQVTVGFEITTDRDLFSRNDPTIDEVGDLTAVQVLERPEGELLYRPYAYTLCEDHGNLSVILNKGCEYRFSVLFVPRAMSFVAKNSMSGGYRQPFVILGKNSQSVSEPGFEYSTTNYFAGLGSGTTAVVDGSSYVLYNRPLGDRHYGEITDRKVVDNSSIDINLRRVAFGLRYDIKNFTEGEVRISVADGQDIILTPTTYASRRDYVTFQGVAIESSAWIEETYSETIPFTVYHKKVGAKEAVVAKREHRFVRNTEYAVVVDLAEKDSKSGLGINVVDKQMNDGGDI